MDEISRRNEMAAIGYFMVALLSLLPIAFLSLVLALRDGSDMSGLQPSGSFWVCT
jgi:hypothetical protein